MTWLRYIWHDSWICDMTQVYMIWLMHTWHNSGIYDMTHAYVTWLIYIWYRALLIVHMALLSEYMAFLALADISGRPQEPLLSEYRAFLAEFRALLLCRRALAEFRALMFLPSSLLSEYKGKTKNRSSQKTRLLSSTNLLSSMSEYKGTARLCWHLLTFLADHREYWFIPQKTGFFLYNIRLYRALIQGSFGL